MVWVLKLGVNLELNVVNGMAGTSMPVNGLHLVSVRCLVTGKNAELKRLDGMSEKPGIISFTRIYAGCFGKTRFKQGMFKTKSVD
ncbi:hypothetical protein EAN91_15235 [Klebsiella pneumoniae]|nr:hypothetical protein EAN91_15235 [Klebsiella pneumoniae]RRF74326.1 hypothetical protein EAO30_19640 [Klebsiella pneumoniae]